MKNRKSEIAVGAVALLAVTVGICSCFLWQSPIAATTLPSNTSSQTAENSDSGFDDTTSEDVPKGSSPHVSADNTSTVENVNGSAIDAQTYDDPESYLLYDEDTGTYSLTEEEEKLGEESLFVGDSICNGLAWCSVLKSKNVYATPSVAANNMLNFDMTYQGEPAKFIPVLKKAKPKYIFFWMGMNDVNLITPEQYCEYYKEIIDVTLANSDADVYVSAITPIRNFDFSKPMFIDQFNFAMQRFIKLNYKERVHFIDFGVPLKNEDGLLDEQYDGGDGVHLSCKAYYIAMHEINKRVVRK